MTKVAIKSSLARNQPAELLFGFPQSYCNKCLLNVLEHPLGCYDERRFSRFGNQSYEKMIAEVMEVFADKTPQGWL